MSYTTTADKYLESAAQHINEAVKDLSKIVIDHCSGHNDYGIVLTKNIKDSLNEFIDIRSRFKNYYDN